MIDPLSRADAIIVLVPDVRVSVSSAPDAKYDPARWWNTEEGLGTVFGETLKLGFYWAKYGVAPF